MIENAIFIMIIEKFQRKCSMFTFENVAIEGASWLRKPVGTLHAVGKWFHYKCMVSSDLTINVWCHQI